MSGCRVDVVICTLGDKGSTRTDLESSQVASVRREEIDRAAEVLGVSSVQMLGFPDGEVENTPDTRREIVRLLRLLRPDVVLTHDPTAVFFGDSYVSHHDHRTVGWAVLDSCSPAVSSPLYFPEAGPAHHVRELLLSGTLQPDHWIDIGATIDLKVKAVECHAMRLEGIDVPEGLSIENVVRHRAQEEGRRAGCTYAEGFRRIRLS